MKQKDATYIEVEEFNKLRSQRNARIKGEAEEFTKTVSLIGITHATDRRRSKGRRFVWTIWLLVGAGLAFYQIQDRTVYYLSYPYNTEFNVQNDKQLLFPQVTICKENLVSKAKAKELGIEESFLKLQDIAKEFPKTDEDFEKLLEKASTALEEFHNATSDWGTISKRISHTWQDLVTKIHWNGVEANATDLVEDIATDVGHCFAISTEKRPLMSRSAGVRSGLVLFLDAKQSESLELMNFDHSIFTGFRILLHDPLEAPRMQEDGIVISPGTVAQLAVSFTNIRNLGPPYYDCDPDVAYRVENCLADCEDFFFLENCKCWPFYLKNVTDIDYKSDKKVCGYLDHLHCLAMFRNNRSQIDDMCVCDQQCYTRSYKYSLSQSPISRAALPFLNLKYQSSNASSLSSSNGSTSDPPDMTIVFVYFPSLTYTNIVAAEAYSFLALLCDVGGALSLLLGATILTVYEVAEFLVIVAADYFRFKPRRRENISV